MTTKENTRPESVTVKAHCERCGNKYTLLIAVFHGKPALQCLACYVRDNPDMEDKLQEWLNNHRAFKMGGGNALSCPF